MSNIIYSLLVLAILFCSSSSASAQQSSGAHGPVRSALLEAIERHGTIVDARSGGSIVSHAIYVKLRRGAANGSASERIARLAPAAGLRVNAATPLAYSTTPVDHALAARLSTRSSARQQAAAESEESISRIVELHYADDVDPHTAAARLMTLAEVEYAEPIPLPEVMAPNDPMLSQQTHLYQTKTVDAWEIFQGDSNVVIGIVDGGIDLYHEDLWPNIKENAGETGTDAQGNDKRTNMKDDDGNGIVDDWKGVNLTYEADSVAPGDTRGINHGTVVSGLAGAATNNSIGVAGAGYRCMFFPVKAARRGSGTVSQGYNGILYCARRGFKVINCSWGGEFSRTGQEIINNAVRGYDAAVVGSGGNAPAYNLNYPAGYRHALGVGGVDANDTFRTTWGEHIDVSAPTGATTVDNNAYTVGGYPPPTSFTAPVASGILALVRARYPDLDVDQSMEQLRLTADNVDSLVDPSMRKLIGYGRINTLRAITTDPFSHPAVLVDTAWLTDETGAPVEGFGIGGKGRIRVRLHNILGPATNLRIRARTYTDDSNAVKIGDTTLTVASLPTDGVLDVPGGFPFSITTIDSQSVRVRFDITGDNGYDDYRYEQILFYKPFITVQTDRLALSFTSRGRLGYEDYPNNRVGLGFIYTGIDMLFEGGFLIASDAAHVLSNVRGDNPDLQNADFTPIELPIASNNYTLTLSDSGAGARRIGLELKARTFTKDPISNAVAIELRVRNTTDQTIDSLRIGLFNDWDFEGASDKQRIVYVSDPPSAVPFYGRVTATTTYVLTSGVLGPVASPIFYAIDNSTGPNEIYSGFTDAKKWRALSNGVGSRNAGEGDVSLVTGEVIAGLAPNAEHTTTFVIGVGASAEEALGGMRNLAGMLSGVAGEETTATTMLGMPRPNPFTRTTTIAVNPATRSARLELVDALGRRVADLTPQLSADGTPTIVTIDGEALAPGSYFVRLMASGRVESRGVVVVK